MLMFFGVWCFICSSDLGMILKADVFFFSLGLMRGAIYPIGRAMNADVGSDVEGRMTADCFFSTVM